MVISVPLLARIFPPEAFGAFALVLAVFESAGDSKCRGEFASNYLYNVESAKRIKDTLGNVKVIVVVREPVGRSLSHIKHLIRDGDIPKMSGEISESQLFAKYRAPGVINWVKKSGISRIYRVINRGDNVVLSQDATEYLRRLFAEDWGTTQRLEASIEHLV